MCVCVCGGVFMGGRLCIFIVFILTTLHPLQHNEALENEVLRCYLLAKLSDETLKVDVIFSLWDV